MKQTSPKLYNLFTSAEMELNPLYVFAVKPNLNYVKVSSEEKI